MNIPDDFQPLEKHEAGGVVVTLGVVVRHGIVFFVIAYGVHVISTGVQLPLGLTYFAAQVGTQIFFQTLLYRIFGRHAGHDGVATDQGGPFSRN